MSRFVFCFVLVFSSHVVALDPSNIDKRAQAVAKHLQPATFSDKGTEKDLEGVKGQVIRLMEELERNERTSNSAPESMLSKAFQFRDKEIGRSQALVSSRSLMAAWKEARVHGAFDGKGKYTGTATSLLADGQSLTFEYILPPSVAPEYSKYIGNVRLVRADRARKPGTTEISRRDLAFIESLKQVKREAETRREMLEREKSKVEFPEKKLNEVGQTAEQEAELYRQAVEAAGELVKREPSVRLQGKLLTRPGHMNKHRYRVGFRVLNASRHPTEIEVEYYVLGFTDELNKIYVMTHEKHELKMRAGQEKVHDVWTKAEGHYVGKVFELDEKKSKKISYKGFIAFAKFGDKGRIAVAASDARMLAYAKGERDGMSTWPDFSK